MNLTLTPWRPHDARTETRDLASNPENIVMLVREWGRPSGTPLLGGEVSKGPRYRAAFFAPDGPDVEDWRDGEILTDDLWYWPTREAAREACERAWAQWQAEAEAAEVTRV